MAETYDDGAPEETDFEFRDWWMRWACSVAGLDRLHRRDVARAAWQAARATAAAPLDALRLAINSCKDVTKLGRFSPSVDPVRWVAQLQAHLESALNATTPTQPETPLAGGYEMLRCDCPNWWKMKEHQPHHASCNLFNHAPEPPDLAAEAELRLRAVACAARDFIWEPENWEAWQDAKESNSVAWPPEFLMLAQAVEKKFGPMPIDDDDKEPTNET